MKTYNITRILLHVYKLTVHLNASLFRSCEHISTSIQSLGMLIDLHIDDKIKSRIHSNAFIPFGALLFNAHRNNHNLHDITDDQAALESKPKPIPKIQTCRQICSYSSQRRIMAVLQMDYAENYTCIARDEIQSGHWNQAQVTLFTSVTLTFQIVVHIRLFIFRSIAVLYGLIRVYTFIRFVANPPYTIFIWSMFITLKIFNIFEVILM